MCHFGSTSLGRANDSDDVQAYFLVSVHVLDVVIDGAPQVVHLLVVHSLLGFAKEAIPSRFDLYEDQDILVDGDYVNIAMARVPTAFSYEVAHS